MVTKDNIKRQTTMKNGWIIQKEVTDNGSRIIASRERVHKNKQGKVIGRSNEHKEISYSKLVDDKDLILDRDHKYLLEDFEDDDDELEL